MALMTCRSCGHYYVTTESAAREVPAAQAQLRCPPCDETRRFAARDNGAGPWKAVVWTGLWFLWLGALVGLISLIKPLG